MIAWLRRDGNAILFGAALLYTLIYLFFWPHLYTSMDESCYFNMAYVYRHGVLYPDQLGQSVVTTFLVDGHEVSKYPPGMAMALAIFSVLGWKTALGFNLFVHIGTFCIVAALLRQWQLPRVYALFYLLHPSAILFSRTLFSDPLSGLLLAGAFLLLLRRQVVLAGVLLGFAALTRTANAVAIPVFALALLTDTRICASELRARFRSVVLFGLGCVPGVALLAGYMFIVAKGQMAAHTGSFALMYFPQMFPFYVMALLILWPGGLVAPFFAQGPGARSIALLTAGYVLLYSLWYYRDQGSNAVESLIVGLRYFMAILPLLVLAYAALLERLLARLRWRETALVVLGALVLVGSVLLHRKHNQLLATMAGARDGILAETTTDSVIFGNTQLRKIFHPAWGERHLEAIPRDSASGYTSIRGALTQNHPVYIATWVRPTRADDRTDDEETQRFMRGLVLQPVTITPSIEGQVHVWRVLSVK